MNNMHAKKAKRKINIAILALLLFSAICISACGVNIAKKQDKKTAKVEGRQQITNDFIELLEADPELKELMQESIHLASVNNPDKKNESGSIAG